MKKFMPFLITIYVIVVGCALGYFYNNYRKHQEDIKNLVKEKLNGRIKTLTNLHRGSFFIEIKTQNQTFEKHSLPIASYVEKYNIKVGDSVSKEENDRKLYFYKRIKNKEVLNFIYEL